MGAESERVARFGRLDEGLRQAGGGCFSPDPSNYTDWLGSKNLQVGQYNTADYAPPSVDKLIAAGIATTNPARRFVAYSQLVRRLQDAVPYVGLHVSKSVQALSPKFTFLGYSQYSWAGAYALDVRLAQ